MAELLPVPSLMSLRIFELSYNVVLGEIMPFASRVLLRLWAIKKSMGALVLFLLLCDTCLSWHLAPYHLAELHLWDGMPPYIWCLNREWGMCSSCSSLLFLRHPAKCQLLYLTRIDGNVVFSSCHCLHWILQDSDEMWGWMPKAWGLQCFSTHCQSLTSRQLLGHPEPQAEPTDGSFRHTVAANSFIQEAKRFHLVCNDRPVSMWPGADDPVMVLDNWLCSSGPCWRSGRVVLTLGRWFLASPKLLLVNWITRTPFPSYMDLTPSQVQHSLSEQEIS